MKTLINTLLLLVLIIPYTSAQMIHLQPGEKIMDMQQDPYTGKIWALVNVADWENKVYVFDANTYKLLQFFDNSTAIKINKLFFCQQNSALIYFVDRVAIFVFNKNTHSVTEHNIYSLIKNKWPGINSKSLHSITQDNEYLWLCFGNWSSRDPDRNGTLAKLNTNTWKIEKAWSRYFSTPPYWPDNQVNSLYESVLDTARNQLWITSDNGLYIFNTQTETWAKIDTLWDHTYTFDLDDRRFHSVRWNANQTKILATHYWGLNA